jgi:hypothetical protein
VNRTFRDDLPAVSVSPMRASGVIDAETSSTFVRLTDSDFLVRVTHRRFPNGDDWAFFACPTCNRRARKLWLLDGAPRCWRCCIASGVGPRSWPMSVRQRAEISVPKLMARLNSKTPARLHPRPDGSMLDRRGALELSLRKSLLALRRYKLRDVDKLGGKS